MILGWGLPGTVVNVYDAIIRPLVDFYLLPFLRAILPDRKRKDKDTLVSYMANQSCLCFGADSVEKMNPISVEFIVDARNLVDHDFAGRRVMPPVSLSVAVPKPFGESPPIGPQLNSPEIRSLLSMAEQVSQPPETGPSDASATLTQMIDRNNNVLEKVTHAAGELSTTVASVIPHLQAMPDVFLSAISALTSQVEKNTEVLSSLVGVVKDNTVAINNLQVSLKETVASVVQPPQALVPPSPEVPDSPFLIPADPVMSSPPGATPSKTVQTLFKDPPKPQRLPLSLRLGDERHVELQDTEIELHPESEDLDILDDGQKKRLKLDDGPRRSPRLSSRRHSKHHNKNSIVTYLRTNCKSYPLPDTYVQAQEKYKSLLDAGSASLATSCRDKPPKPDVSLSNVAVMLTHLLPPQRVLKSTVVKPSSGD